MRKLTSVLSIALSTAALALSGTAMAQTAPAAPAKARPPMADQTRADAQARAERIFARMDTNQDGTLNEADRAAMKAAMFDRLDTDRNGSVSPTELEARRGDRQGRMARRGNAPAMTDAQKAERRAEMFARIDTDKNGALSRAEFEAMQAARGAKAGRAMRQGGGQRAMMKADGPITRQAFVDSALARFDKLDTDRNGTLTGAERKAFRDTMRQQWQARKAGQQG